MQVGGAWRLIYSTITILGSKRTKLGLRDFITLGDFFQSINVAQVKFSLFDVTSDKLHQVLILSYMCIDNYKIYIFLWMYVCMGNYVSICGPKLPGEVHLVPVCLMLHSVNFIGYLVLTNDLHGITHTYMNMSILYSYQYTCTVPGEVRIKQTRLVTNSLP